MATKKEQTTKSEFGKLNKRDFTRGLLVAACSGLSGAILEVLSSEVSFDKQTLIYLLIGALTGVSGYLQVNLGTNSKGEFIIDPKKQKINKKRILNKKK